MHSIQSALQAAFDQNFGAGALDKRLRQIKFDKAVERGRALMLAATRATAEGRLTDALSTVRRDRFACAAFIAHDLSRERKRFVSVKAAFSELELMEQLWEEKIAEQKARPLPVAG